MKRKTSNAPSTPSSPPLVFALLVLATGAASCFDPVHSDDVDALGDEVNGVRPGPNHRPGQPCLACHGGDGPGSPEFSLAGTIYPYRDEATAGVAGVTVSITDSSTPPNTIKLVTNEVGNFYLEKDRQTVTFPAFVGLIDDRIVATPPGLRPMITPIGRTGGCGACHIDNIRPGDRTSYMPHVYLNLVRSP